MRVPSMPCALKKQSFMKAPTLFKEYIWLVNTIYHARAITLADINKRWQGTEMSGGVEMSRATFIRHIHAIEDIFGIIIDCDRKAGYTYYISNARVLREDTVQNWMLSTLSVNNIISESMGLQDRILLEHIPSEGDTLQLVIKAMKENRLIDITYRRYASQENKTYTLAPYCIKLFHRRWYLLGRFENGSLAVFSFDRIESLQLLTEKFKLDDAFDAAAFFNECFGIVVGDGSQTERIVVRAYGVEPYYMRDLPWHPSQRELQVTDDYTDFEFRLRPTSDFKGHLLSRGQWTQVLEPQSLADEIVLWHQNAIDRYKKNKISEPVP